MIFTDARQYVRPTQSRNAQGNTTPQGVEIFQASGRQASRPRSEVLYAARAEDSTFASEKQGGHPFQAKSQVLSIRQR